MLLLFISPYPPPHDNDDDGDDDDEGDDDGNIMIVLVINVIYQLTSCLIRERELKSDKLLAVIFSQ